MSVECSGCAGTDAALDALTMPSRAWCACTCHDSRPIMLNMGGEVEVPLTVDMALPMFERMAREVLDEACGHLGCEARSWSNGRCGPHQSELPLDQRGSYT